MQKWNSKVISANRIKCDKVFDNKNHSIITVKEADEKFNNASFLFSPDFENIIDIIFDTDEASLEIPATGWLISKDDINYTEPVTIFLNDKEVTRETNPDFQFLIKKGTVLRTDNPVIFSFAPCSSEQFDVRSNGTPYDIWKAVPILEDNTIKIRNLWLPDVSGWYEDTIPKNTILSVIDEKAYSSIEKNENNFVCNMQTSKIEIGGNDTKREGLFCNDMSSSNIQTFNSDLSSLTDGTYMFKGCEKLSTISDDLSSLNKSSHMFDGCSDLTSFSFNLSNLQTGDYMFRGCKNISSFESDLSSLEDGDFMFEDCSDLVSFSGNITSLKSGNEMFKGCKLNYDSAMNILNNIPNNDSDGVLSLTISDEMALQLCENLNLSGEINIPSYDNGFFNFNHKGWSIKLSSQTGVTITIGYPTTPYDITLETGYIPDMTNWFEDTAPKNTILSIIDEKAFSTPEESVNFVCNIHTSQIVTGANLGKNIQVFKSDLSSLSTAQNMFAGCSNLRIFESDLSSLTNSSYMFDGCSSLTEFTVAMPKTKTATYMFRDCISLTEFEMDLPTLTNASYMFYNCSNITKVSGNFPKLTTVTTMFRNCEKLTTVDFDLSKVASGSNFLHSCTSITSFNKDMPNLQTGTNMFYGCTSLTSFTGNLNKYKKAQTAFYGCTKLTEFNSDIPSLENGHGMFSKCKLNKTSVLNIIDCLKNRNTWDGTINETYSGKLTIGIDKNLKTDTDILTSLGISEGETSASILGYGGGTWSITLQWN